MKRLLVRVLLLSLLAMYPMMGWGQVGTPPVETFPCVPGQRAASGPQVFTFSEVAVAAALIEARSEPHQVHVESRFRTQGSCRPSFLSEEEEESKFGLLKIPPKNFRKKLRKFIGSVQKTPAQETALVLAAVSSCCLHIRRTEKRQTQAP